MGNIKVLVAEDEKNLGKVLKRELEIRGYNIELLENGEDALNSAKKGSFDVILLDILMPKKNGIDVLREIKEAGISPEVIIMTGHATVQTALDAMKLDAYDYITKPFKFEKIDTLIRNAAEKKKLVAENLYLKRRIKDDDKRPLIITKSPRIEDLLKLASKVAPTVSPVMVYGESGTGKELIARFIHFNSPRCDHPFIPINCAALQENILENELFGHERGAFTGADKQKPGLFEIANKGTLFLDEIGELSPAIQAKLLRVIETGSFFRVGGTKEIYVDVRIVSATNKDLKMEAEEKRFRKDLLYRIGIISLTLPPLKERKEDIPLLAGHFIKSCAPAGVKVLSPEAAALMLEYHWPGNVRELLHIIQRAVLLSPNAVIEPTDLPLEIQQLKGKMAEGVKENPKTLADAERQHIMSILKEADGQRGKAAQILGIDPKTLYRKIIAYNIKI